MEGERVLERLRLSLQGFDIDSTYSSVLCKSRISNQGCFSGPAGFNSKSAGSCDGITLSLNSMLSIPSPEDLKEARCREDLGLKREGMVESRRLSAGVASGSGTGSGGI